MKAKKIITQALHENFSEFTAGQACAVIEAIKENGFVLIKEVKLVEIIGAIAVIEPITRGNPYMDFVKRELNVIGNIANAAIEAQGQNHD